MEKEFLKFSPVGEDDFGLVYSDLERAFPYEERRTPSDEKKLLEVKNCHFDRVLCGDKPVGCTVLWEFENFVFLEHIMIKTEERGKGYGSETLYLIGKTYKNKPIILEVEPPDGGYASKRIAFYERNGFTLNEKTDYMQPSYHGGKGVPLLLMTSEPVGKERTEEFTCIIREKCYGAR